jgi:hypothetical protein
MREADEFDDQFRLVFDLQGYAQNDISDAFVFDHALCFHLTEQNTEEFQGYDDIWSTILDERVLIKLEAKIEALRAKLAEDAKPKPDDASGASSPMSSAKASVVAPASPSNIKMIDSTIKSGVQRELYMQFMSDSKAESQGLKFDLTRAQEPSEDSEGEAEADQGPTLLASQPVAQFRQRSEQEGKDASG